MRFLTGLMAVALAATLLVACGGDDGDGDSPEAASRPAPPASDFPAADGRPLEQVLSAATE